MDSKELVTNSDSKVGTAARGIGAFGPGITREWMVRGERM
jgi:hypothetical protein